MENIKLTKLEEDLLEVFECAIDSIDESTYRNDVSREITDNMNMDGSFTFNSQEAKESSLNYIDTHYNLICSAIEYFDKYLGMDDVTKELFTSPESFQVKLLIEISAAILWADSKFSDWVMGDELVNNLDEIEAIFDNVCDNIRNRKIDFDRIF